MVVLPALVLAIPLLTAGLLAAFQGWLPAPLRQAVALAASIAVLLVDAVLWRRSCLGAHIYWFGDWFPRGRVAIGVGWLVEPVGAALALLAALLVTLGFVYALNLEKGATRYFLPLMLVFLAAMGGFCFTADLFNLFVFFELMSIAAFALCGLKSGEPAPLQGAFNFAITNSVGAYFTLTGIGLIYAATGALNLGQIGRALQHRHDGLVIVAFLLLATGFLVKGAIIPFHFWLADAHAVAPSSVCIVFSGIMVPLGVFAVARLVGSAFGGLFYGHSVYTGIFGTLGAVTAVVGGVLSFAQHHLKRMLAFSTVAHSGIMLTGFALATPAAVAGALIYLWAHALIKGGLFLLAGILLARLGSISEPSLFGCGRKHWGIGALWMLGGLGLAGVPPFATASALDWIRSGAAPATGRALMPCLHFAGILSGGAVLRSGMRLFGFGDPGPSDTAAQTREQPDSGAKIHRVPIYLWAPPLLCMSGGVALTFVHQLRSVPSAAAQFLSPTAFAQAVYGGASPLTPTAPLSGPFHTPLPGIVAGLLAAGLAAAALGRMRLRRRWRWVSHLEGPLRPLRGMHTGHSGDYVAWITAGTAVLGVALFFALR